MAHLVSRNSKSVLPDVEIELNDYVTKFISNALIHEIIVPWDNPEFLSLRLKCSCLTAAVILDLLYNYFAYWETFIIPTRAVNNLNIKSVNQLNIKQAIIELFLNIEYIYFFFLTSHQKTTEVSFLWEILFCIRFKFYPNTI